MFLSIPFCFEIRDVVMFYEGGRAIDKDNFAHWIPFYRVFPCGSEIEVIQGVLLYCIDMKADAYPFEWNAMYSYPWV